MPSGPMVIGRRGSNAIGKLAGRRGQGQHQARDRQHRDARLQRRVAQDLLEMDDEQEERDARDWHRRRSVTRLAAVNCRDRKISSGSIGCRTLRSATTKPASEARPTAPADSTPAVAPRSPAVDERPGHAGQARRQSAPRPRRRCRGRRVGSRVSGTCRSATATTATASGTLIRKIRRHDPTPMSHPPTNGPIAAAIPDSPDHAPTARPRSPGANEA